MRFMGSLFILLALTAGMPASSVAQSPDFGTGMIVAVEAIPGASAADSGGGDAPLASDVNRYNLSIQLGDSVYVCRAKTPSAIDLSWVKGKEVPAKVKGNMMYIKRANGKTTKLSIIKTTKA